MLKGERVNRRIYQTRREARADIFDYIERFYNPRCRRRLEEAKQQELLFTQPSVEKGYAVHVQMEPCSGRVRVSAHGKRVSSQPNV